MYFSVQYIGVKLNQDYADFNENTLIICDGIGGFPESGKISKIVVDQFISKRCNSVSELMNDEELKKLIDNNFIGGTTFISATNLNDPSKLHIEYLGNGGIIHLHGDFSSNVNSNEPYRYGDIMIPHIAPNGALTKHISHNSKEIELSASTIELNLNYITGDILLLFSDGISSLEGKVIINDNNGRYWRFEMPSIQFILRELDLFLKTHICPDTFEYDLILFNKDILEKLKAENYLEDDASLGIIISDIVLDHYKAKVND